MNASDPALANCENLKMANKGISKQRYLQHVHNNTVVSIFQNSDYTVLNSVLYLSIFNLRSIAYSTMRIPLSKLVMSF